MADQPTAHPAVDQGLAPPSSTSADPSADAGGLDTRYEHLRDAALHARAEAFPLGFGVLRRGGVTAWRRALPGPNSPTTFPIADAAATSLAATHTPLPTALAAELVDVLAAVALAGTTPDPPRSHRRGHWPQEAVTDVHRHRVVEGDRRAPVQDRVALCPPVHPQTGTAQHRIGVAPVRPARAGDRVGLDR